MSDNKNIIINLQVDTSGVEEALRRVVAEISTVETTLLNYNKAVLAWQPEVKAVLEDVVGAINAIVFDEIVQAIGELKSTFESKNGKETIGKLGEKAYDSIFALLLESIKVTGKAEKPAPLALPAPSDTNGCGKNSEGDSSTNGIVNSMLGGIGDLSSLMPDGEMLQNLSDLTAKLKESAAAWAAQMGAKIADKAVDLQIIALYVADYVKAFGATVAQLATSTAG